VGEFGVCSDCGARFVRHARGRPRTRCERCNRRRQNARSRHVPVGTAYDRWDRDSLRAALEVERAKLAALRTATRTAEDDIASLEAQLARVEQRLRDSDQRASSSGF